MTVYNLGSINIDHVYRVDHLPQPGQTLHAHSYVQGLGGKGANQSVAAARAGATVRHIGAIGPQDWPLDRLKAAGVDITHITQGDTPTGHAIITVDAQGENSIVLYPGANSAIDPDLLHTALSQITGNDTLLLQNETSCTVEAAKQAHAAGACVIYSAAPFEIEALRAVLPFVSLIAVNEGEAEALTAAFGTPDVPLLVTLGPRGAEYRAPDAPPIHVPGFAVQAVDTTGAGDCFAGNFAAARDAGHDLPAAMRFAAAAAALQVTRPGAGDAMPEAAETRQFLEDHG